MTTRLSKSSGGLLILLILVSTVSAQIVPGSIEVKLDTVVQWSPELDSSSPVFELTPTNMALLNDGTGRILVSTLAGTIRVLEPSGDAWNLLSEPLINSNQVGFELQAETGMTAIAIHPDFAGNPGDFGYGKLYTTTSENGVGNGGLSNDDVDFSYDNEVHQEVIREWNISAIVGDSNINTLPDITIADSRELLRIDQPGPYHNLYDMSFNRAAKPGQDDYGQLFISLGDGGRSGSNGSNFQTQIREPQDLNTIYGNVLRINPDPGAHAVVRVVSNSTAPNAGQPAYSISDTNLFNGDDGVEDRDAATLAEIYAYGLRSPYRMNFDSLTGDLYIGDVGEITREEVTRIQSGTNAGWGRFEGVNLFNDQVVLGGPSPHTPPVFDYGSNEGRTVVGGIVYRGSAIPQLQGKMVLADFGSFLPSGRLFYGIVDSNDPDYGKIFEMQLNPDGAMFPIDTNGDDIPDTNGLLPDRIFSIEEDADHELYLVAGQDPRNNSASTPGAYLVKIKGSYETVEVTANSLTAIRGILIGGSLGDASESDDIYLQYQPFITLNPNEPPVWLMVQSTLGTGQPIALSFALEASANTIGLNQTIEMLNYDSGEYELVDSSTATLSDSVVTVEATGDVSRFVEAGTNNVNTRLGWKALGPVILFPWTISIDQMIWTVTQ